MSAPAPYTAPAGLRTGPVHLAVLDLPRMEAFHRELLGLERLPHPLPAQRDEAAAAPVAFGPPGGPPLLLLSSGPGLRPRPPHTTGLFHVALRVPDRPALARVLLRLHRRRVPLGASDHRVSEALYLEDPEGNGIEIYADRPRESWPADDGTLVMTTEPLDVEELLRTVGGPGAEDATLPPGTRVGHIHLQVSDIPPAVRFYQEALGLELQARYGQDAAFLSAGGYHHHIGVNVWASRGAPAPPPDAAGLRWATIELPSAADVAALGEHLGGSDWGFEREGAGLALRDPAGNALRVLPAQASPEASA